MTLSFNFNYFFLWESVLDWKGTKESYSNFSIYLSLLCFICLLLRSTVKGTCKRVQLSGVLYILILFLFWILYWDLGVEEPFQGLGPLKRFIWLWRVYCFQWIFFPLGHGLQLPPPFSILFCIDLIGLHGYCHFNLFHISYFNPFFALSFLLNDFF